MSFRFSSQRKSLSFFRSQIEQSQENQNQFIAWVSDNFVHFVAKTCRKLIERFHHLFMEFLCLIKTHCSPVNTL